MSRRTPGSLDQLDRQIIASLEDDGRRTNTEIANLLGVVESTIRKRVHRLVRDEVIRITAVANPLKLDYPIVAIFGIHAAPNQVSEVADALQAMLEFRFIGLTIGEYDFVAEAWFRSLDNLHDFLTTRLLMVGGITHVDTSHVLRMIRYTYDWGSDRRRQPSPDRVPRTDIQTSSIKTPVRLKRRASR